MRQNQFGDAIHDAMSEHLLAGQGSGNDGTRCITIPAGSWTTTVVGATYAKILYTASMILSLSRTGRFSLTGVGGSQGYEMRRQLGFPKVTEKLVLGPPGFGSAQAPSVLKHIP